MSANFQGQAIGTTLVTINPSTVISFTTMAYLCGVRIQYHSGGSLTIQGASTTAGLGAVLSTTIPYDMFGYRGSFSLSAVGATTFVSVTRFLTS